MNDLEKMIELLDKDNRTGEEQHFLDELIKNNPQAKRIKDAYLNLKASLKKDEHIDEELMAEYVMSKNNLSSNRLIVLLVSKVEDHLRSCVVCEKLFTELNTEYCAVDSFVSQSVTELVEPGKTGSTKSIFPV